MRICLAISFLRSAWRIFHGGAFQALYLSTIKICYVRQLEIPTIACRNDKNLLCAVGFKPSAHSRFLSLRHAIVGFSSCRTQQIFIVDKYKAWSAPPWNILQALRRNDIARQIRMSTLYLCISIGLLSHVFHDFCRDTPHTADFCFGLLRLKTNIKHAWTQKLVSCDKNR